MTWITRHAQRKQGTHILFLCRRRRSNNTEEKIWACAQKLPVHILGSICNNLPGFYCWGDLILRKFKNQFCARSAHPGQKYESGLLFNTNIPGEFRAGEWVLVKKTRIKSMLRLFITYMLYYMLEKGEMEPNDNLFEEKLEGSE